MLPRSKSSLNKSRVANTHVLCSSSHFHLDIKGLLEPKDPSNTVGRRACLALAINDTLLPPVQVRHHPDAQEHHA